MNMDWDGLESIWKNKYVTGFRRLVYLVSPNETSFKHIKDVPAIRDEAVPYFAVCVVLEILILWIQGRPNIRFSDSFNSVAHGLLSLLHSLLSLDIELHIYIWVYDNFCIYPLPWDSPWTWVITMLGVDFCYYWLHRCGHEVNIMWAGHQTHHSSEDYNLTTALRQSMIHRYLSWMFYLPLALFIPPSQFLVHAMFNLLYQFWIHTEVVRNLGPLELILNTPSHHRVHHGRNPYCIDKNYAGTLIIWDRMFGTFEPEGTKVVYGLVHPLTTWDPLYGQFCQLIHIFKTFPQMNTWSDKLATFWKGPGWMPGKPRLGDPKDIPEIEYPVIKYSSHLKWWGMVYIWIHFTLILAAYSFLAFRKHELSSIVLVAYILMVLYSLTTFGALFDSKSYGPLMEFFRCIICFSSALLYKPISFQFSVINVIFMLYLISGLLWGYITIASVPLNHQKKKI